MTDGFVKIQPDSTGKAVDTTELPSASGQIVERQRMVIASDYEPGSTVAADRYNGLAVQVTNAVLNVLVANDPTAPLPVSGQVTAQITSSTGLPLDLGQKPMLFSVPVTVAPDQPPISVSMTSTGAPAAVTASDGAIATEGTTQDISVSGDAPGSIIAQLRGINAQYQQTNGLIQQMVDLLGAVLAQLNNIGLQQGANVTQSPVVTQIPAIMQ